MTHDTPLPVVTSLIDLDTTFLPVAEMRQISRVTALEGRGIEGEVDLGPDHWVWEQHFPGDPIFPGHAPDRGRGPAHRAVGLGPGATGTTTAGAHQCGVSQACGQWAPGLHLKAEVRRKRHLNFGSVEISSEGTVVATVEAVLVVLG